MAGDSGRKRKKEESGSRRRRKKSEEEEAMNTEDGIDPKTRDVVHVRAKRGQATDSHSLAERV